MRPLDPRMIGFCGGQVLATDPRALQPVSTSQWQGQAVTGSSSSLPASSLPASRTSRSERISTYRLTRQTNLYRYSRGMERIVDAWELTRDVAQAVEAEVRRRRSQVDRPARDVWHGRVGIDVGTVDLRVRRLEPLFEDDLLRRICLVARDVVGRLSMRRVPERDRRAAPRIDLRVRRGHLARQRARHSSEVRPSPA